MNNHHSKAFLALLMTVLLFCILPISASAEGTAYQASFSVTVSDPESAMPDDAIFTLRIDRVNKHAPLPVPNELIARKEDTVSFAPITFTEPGNYQYIVRELASNDENIVCDTNRYKVTVTVIRGDGGRLEGGYTLSLDDDNQKPSAILFSNRVRTGNGSEILPADTTENTSSTSPTSSDSTADTASETAASDTGSDAKNEKPWFPGTGEALSPAFLGLILSGALFVLFLLTRRQTRKNKAN